MKHHALAMETVVNGVWIDCGGLLVEMQQAGVFEVVSSNAIHGPMSIGRMSHQGGDNTDYIGTLSKIKEIL